jgi:putative phosphoribosyl transferase
VVDHRSVQIPVRNGAELWADLVVPDQPGGVIIFAHGTGSSRHSPRNQSVAAHLQARCFATLLVDLLTFDEEAIDARTGQLRFSIDLLAGRLLAAAAFVHDADETAHLPIGYFGASTGAAAALVATAEQPAGIAAVVSRGGRPDLAGSALAAVTAPTLLLVGELDDVVLAMNRAAYERMIAPRRLDIIAGATHLFEEPGALDAVALRAGDWFTEHLAPAREGAR